MARKKKRIVAEPGLRSSLILGPIFGTRICKLCQAAFQYEEACRFWGNLCEA
jgi:hypothetical protein